jgi:hypothetical protein
VVVLDVLLPQRGAKFFEPLDALPWLDRFGGGFGEKFLRARQGFLAGHDRTAKRGRFLGPLPAPQGEQIIQPRDRPMGLGGDDPSAAEDLPIARGACEDEIARFGVDQHVPHLLQPAEGEHGGVER